MLTERPRLTFAERLYLPQVLQGVGITTRHFARNLALHILHLFGLAKDRSAAVTTQYPEQRKTYSEGFRGAPADAQARRLRPLHGVLPLRDGLSRQVHQHRGGRAPRPEVEKYPVRYEIDTLQCIYCGMCVEACPCDAIRMDTFVHPRVWGYRREDFIEPKTTLMERSRVLQEQGRDALMDDMQRDYREGRDRGPAVR
jgi:NADH-quinone oxidoreductase subunit I